MTEEEQKKMAIAKLLLLAKSSPEMVLLIDDLLSREEIEKIYQRVRIVDCLDKNFSQRATLAKTGAAIATVTRGAELMRKGRLRLPKTIQKARECAWWDALFWCV